MKKVLSILLVAAFIFALTACGSSSKSNTLVMATNAEFQPYEYHEGDDIVGIDVELATAIAEKLGMELKIEDMDFDAIIPAVQSGKADFGAAGMTVTEDRQEQVDFTDPYTTAVQVIIVTEDSDIAGPDDLVGKKIGVQQGTTGDIYATGDYGDENIERYKKGFEAVQALAQNKIDAVVIDNEPAKAFVADAEGLKIVEAEYAVEEYAICLAKDSEMLEKFNQAIKELKEDGTLDEIISKYISAD